MTMTSKARPNTGCRTALALPAFLCAVAFPFFDATGVALAQTGNTGPYAARNVDPCAQKEAGDIVSAKADDIGKLKSEAGDGMKKAYDDLQASVDKLYGKDGTPSAYTDSGRLNKNTFKDMGIDGQIVILKKTMAALAEVGAEKYFVLKRKAKEEAILEQLQKELVSLTERFARKIISYDEFTKMRQVLDDRISKQWARLAEVDKEFADAKGRERTGKTLHDHLLLKTQENLNKLEVQRAELKKKITDLQKDARKWLYRYKCAEVRKAKLDTEKDTPMAASVGSREDVLARVRIALKKVWPGQTIDFKVIEALPDRFRALVKTSDRYYNHHVIYTPESKAEREVRMKKLLDEARRNASKLDLQIVKANGLAGAAIDTEKRSFGGYWSVGIFGGTNYLTAGRSSFLNCGHAIIEIEYTRSTNVTSDGHKYKYNNKKQPGSYYLNHPGYQSWVRLKPTVKADANEYGQRIIRALHDTGACRNSP